MKTEINLLIDKMTEYGIDWYLVPSSDCHSSEYVTKHFACRQFLSEFTGSNGNLLVSRNKALLWTDGRYYIQAAMQLKDTGIELMKVGEEGVLSIKEYLRANMSSSDTLGFDGRVCNAAYINDILQHIGCGKSVIYDKDLCDMIWTDRPRRPASKAYVIGTEFTGESYLNKIARVRAAMESKNCKFLFLSKLDDIMWLFNMRGEDIAYNPVLFSYALISKDECYIFIAPESVTDEFALYLKINNVVLQDYDQVYTFLENDDIFSRHDSVEPNLLADLSSVNYYAYSLLKAKTNIINDTNPTTTLKAIKNATEIENMKETFLLDSVAFVKFMYWLDCRKSILLSSLTGGRYLKDEKNYIISEGSAAAYLDNLRSQIPGFKGLSFPTISAFGANAAMMHYEYGRDGGSLLQLKDMLLVDSGGQYIGGTTDVTRTLVMGDLTHEQKRDFTLVVKGMLNLMNTKFIKGCTGRNLDIMARAPLWRYGMDYKCGTGHGVGYFSNVHEGPQAIRWRYQEGASETALEPGMTITDEPGVYKEDRYGIRIENALLVCDYDETDDGRFLCFEPLTYVPIDLAGIDFEYLDGEDIKQLIEYQNKSIDLVSQYLDEEQQNWIESYRLVAVDE